MQFYVLTLFPEMIRSIINTSITGRAVKNGFLSLETINIREYSTRKTNRVDDYPYGGGAGMVLEPEPVYQAIRAVEEKIGHKPRVVYMTPQAQVLNQTKVEELAREEELVLLCGHYEGIDERVLEEMVTDYISIGDYVLTGGELGAAVLIDAVSRFVPGVLSNEESSQFESLQDNLLEYPQYTRPEIWHEKKVPEVLLSGDHNRIEEWRHQKSIERTAERRPDLLAGSYQITCVTAGGNESSLLGGRILRKVTRYGKIMDYNRRKLQKTRMVMEKDELLLLVMDESSIAGSESEDAIPVEERFRNLYGNDTPVILIYEGSVQAEELLVFLRSRGFLPLEPEKLPFSASEDEITGTALNIRKKTLQI
ncbi:MAG: tRNA (guanosine(37)-N1)-methyltransferase TrmD [Eubacteriales bacterium]|nr:tRNA (guanosine(37)-N1)-methyltransferase TrmD [Eubacteriales bacterium]